MRNLALNKWRKKKNDNQNLRTGMIQLLHLASSLHISRPAELWKSIYLVADVFCQRRVKTKGTIKEII